MAMSSTPSLIGDAVASGVADISMKDSGTAHSMTRMSEALRLVRGRTVLFMGAAISTFKPAQLPMWNEFVKLLWTSCIDVALPENEQSVIREGLLNYFDSVKRQVPNHMVTETIARRLGMGYLNVLEAFEAQRNTTGDWAINHVHKWAASCLSSGSVAAVMTTNFDNYIEKALESLGADTYQITGDHLVDDGELSNRLSNVHHSKRLVLVVNGAKAFAFVRSLMPHLGGGKISFLFKLHGSCYDPSSCIDTRLQRTQGLPSFCTDILDTLLKRAVWLVAGFSGSDMNDNLNYLRFLSNKQHARIFWTSEPKPHQESAVQRLTTAMPYEPVSCTGLSHVKFWFKGPRTSVDDDFALFDKKIVNWAEGLGQNWCKLVLVDLLRLFESKSPSIELDASLVEQLSGSPKLRQDWNGILDGMDLRHLAHQANTANACAILWSALSELNFDTEGLQPQRTADFCRNYSTSLASLRALQYNFGSQEMQDRAEPLHAQAWVLSALSGLTMLFAGQTTASVKAFERSSTMARLVGDDDTIKLVTTMIAATYREQKLSGKSIPERQLEKPLAFSASLVACIPGMDNVSSKLNAAGMPPQVYIRALLHRSILFADSMVVMPNTIANSTVFVDEVLFQGEIEELNATYIDHLIVVLPDHIRDKPRKISEFRRSRRKGYLFEPVDSKHLDILDEYFDDPANAHRVFYFDETIMGSGYGNHLCRQVNPQHRRRTTDHLIQYWHHRGRKTSAPAALEHERSHSVRHAVQDLILSISHLTELLKGRAPTRSELYKFADLFDEAHDNPQTLMSGFLVDVEKADMARVLEARERIVSRPWMYGPLCHEMFDIPYMANMIFSLQEQLQHSFHIFLEDSDTNSWTHTGKVRSSQAGQGISVNPCTPGVDQQCSALLLGQLSSSTLLQAREELSFARSRILAGKALTEEEVARVQDSVAAYTNGPEKLQEVTVAELVELSEDTKVVARRLLKQCVFIVRKDRALDPMYEQAQLSIPGLSTLSTAELEPLFHEVSY